MGAFTVERVGGVTECLVVYCGTFPLVYEAIVPVRIHSGCLTSEVFASRRCDCEWQLGHALDYISEAGLGLVVYIPAHEGRGHGITQKLKALALMDRGLTTVAACRYLRIEEDRRDYPVAMTILSRLGITQIELITNNPAKINAATAAGLEVVRRIPSIMQSADPEIRAYITSKVDQSGHLT